jgi:hypothetical protein
MRKRNLLKWTVTDGMLSIKPAASASNHWEAMTFTFCEVEPFAWAESVLHDDFFHLWEVKNSQECGKHHSQ